MEISATKFECQACGASYRLKESEPYPMRCSQCQFPTPAILQLQAGITCDTTAEPEHVISDEAQARKDTPIYTCFIKYFPRATAAVAQVSKVANDQHNPGTEPHWDRSKSADEQDAMMRHVLDVARGEEVDTDGMLHRAKVAWRAMADLEKFLEGE